MDDGTRLINDILQALVVADDERKAAALRILRGEGSTKVRPPVEPLLTLAALGRSLNLHPATLWRWRVPGVRLAGRPRYRLTEVEAYLSSPEFQARAAELRRERRAGKEIAFQPARAHARYNRP